MELKVAHDIFLLSIGDIVTKRNLYDLVQFSKVESSSYWSNIEGIIGNTPQQGINWVGQLPEVQAVIIKNRRGSYDDDGWSDETKTKYRYSFKKKKGQISYTEKANVVLIRQPEHRYPILLFTEDKNGWLFEGIFSVSEIDKKFVVLHRANHGLTDKPIPSKGIHFEEGERRYLTHLLAERSKGAVNLLKRTEAWVCDICSENFFVRYGVKYIEAHHKVPISTYSASAVVALSDFALLCPNCHRAVHIFMRESGYEYIEIKNNMRTKFSKSK